MYSSLHYNIKDFFLKLSGILVIALLLSNNLIIDQQLNVNLNYVLLYILYFVFFSYAILTISGFIFDRLNNFFKNLCHFILISIILSIISFFLLYVLGLTIELNILTDTAVANRYDSISGASFIINFFILIYLLGSWVRLLYWATNDKSINKYTVKWQRRGINFGIFYGIIVIIFTSLIFEGRLDLQGFFFSMWIFISLGWMIGNLYGKKTYLGKQKNQTKKLKNDDTDTTR